MINSSPLFAGYACERSKVQKSQSRNSSAKKSKALAASVVLVRVFQNQTLEEMSGAQAFLRRISVSLTPEALSRLGINCYAATKKGSLPACCVA